MEVADNYINDVGIYFGSFKNFDNCEPHLQLSNAPLMSATAKNLFVEGTLSKEVCYETKLVLVKNIYAISFFQDNFINYPLVMCIEFTSEIVR